MEKILRKFNSHEEMKRAEIAYWQSRPAHERIAAVSTLTTEAYALKGFTPHVSRLQGPPRRVQRPSR
jgi:hypothetical protein